MNFKISPTLVKYRPLIIIILSFLLIFLVRLQSVGGFHGLYTDVYLEDLGSILQPQRQYLSAQFQNILPEDQAVLLSGILLGQKGDLSKTLKDDLIATSTIHIVVVSGQNLSLLAGFCLLLAPRIGRRKTIILTLLIIVLYSLLTGLQIPVLRAAIMSTIALIGVLLGRDRQNAWILILTALVMLIYEPNWLFSISFQLSFLATFAVVVIAPILISLFRFIPSLFREDLAVSLAAQLMTLPIIAANFGQISLIGVLANLLVLWVVSPVMIAGIILLVSLLFLPQISPVCALIPYIFLTYFLYIIQFFSQIPFALVKIDQLHPLVWVGYYILLFGVFSVLAQKTRSNSSNTPEISSKYL